ncbi:hypothetical protein ACOMHN_016235 [Nucella lapillus]
MAAEALIAEAAAAAETAAASTSKASTPKASTPDGIQSGLFRTCRTGTWQDVLDCVEQGALLEVPDKTNLNALHYACVGNNTEVVTKMFIEKNLHFKGNLFAKSYMDETPLHTACRLGYEQLAVWLFKSSHTTAVLTNDRKETPFHFACIYGHDALVRQLLELEPDMLRARDRGGNTALHRAVRLGNVDMVKTLLECKADVNTQNQLFNNALHESIKWAHWDIMELIAGSPNVDINAFGEHHYSPLHLACLGNNTQAVDALLACGANPKVYGMLTTSLHTASANSQLAIMRSLLKAGADINAVDGVQFTPLALASNGGLMDVVKVLLQHGALVKVQCALCPVKLAKKAGHEQVAKLLTEHVGRRPTAR